MKFIVRKYNAHGAVKEYGYGASTFEEAKELALKIGAERIDQIIGHTKWRTLYHPVWRNPNA